jgi:hypothetical protein
LDRISTGEEGKHSTRTHIAPTEKPQRNGEGYTGKSAANRVNRGLDPVVQMQLGEDAADVVLDGVLAEQELVPDL